MALGVFTSGKSPRGHGRGTLAWAWLLLLVPAASCVPAASVQSPELAFSAVERPIPAPLAEALPLPDAAAPPLSPGPLAASEVFRGRTPLDRLRSLDCLAQAIYYEAASESEDGQRAVAQVVLNRVRHPAWPNSVCGVVYQGPMRPGGGCQFTFTCDGSLARRAGGIAWARARLIAAEALDGRTFAGVGLSTHYHTHAVSPSWAPRLVPTGAIGAHAFYRLPGTLGAPTAFAARYAGTEALPVPGPQLVRRAAAPLGLAGWAMPPAPSAADLRAAVTMPSDIAQDPRWTANLPESTIREEYRQSGQWRADAPASVTGR